MLCSRFPAGRPALAAAALLSLLGPAASASSPKDALPRPVRVAAPLPAATFNAAAPALSAAIVAPAKGTTGKMGRALRDLFTTLNATSALVDGRTLSTDIARVRRDHAVQVTLSCTGWSAVERARLEAAGFEYETECLSPEILVQGWLPPSGLAAIEAEGFVRWIKLPSYPVVNLGSVTVQSDTILRSANVRSSLGVTGAGSRVGVFSDSADQRSEAQAKGDLPSDASIYLGKVGSGGDEGTAMMEIVYDMAPGALLAFYGPETSVDMANGITDMRTHGCNVLVDDLTFPGEPWYEDGPIDASISANVAAGAVYVTCASNYAQDVHDTAFSGTTATLLGQSVTAHNFGPLETGVPVTMIPVLVPAGATTNVQVQWDSKWGNATDDYDIYMTDINGQSLYAKSEDSQGTGTNQSPYPQEYMSVTNNGTSNAWGFVTVVRYSGVARNFKLKVWNGALDSYYRTLTGSILANNKAKDAIVVAAIDAADATHTNVEEFSSRGPCRVTYPASVVYNKPDITGIDGVFVSGAGGFGQEVTGQAYHVFFGTSASAPTVAAVAALVRSANASLTPAQVRTALTSTALERGVAGVDTTFGSGLVDAVLAVQSVMPQTTLAFQTQPAGAVAGAAFATQPVVKAVNGSGATVTSFTGPVTLAIKAGTGTSGATLGGTVTRNAVAGVATFSGLSINAAGAGYVLTASSTQLGAAANVDSAAFTVTAPAVATQLAFTTQPVGAAANQAFATQPVVAVQDATGALFPGYSGSVALAIKLNTGTKGATLKGTTTVNVVNGVATFTGLNIDKAGSGYVLRATSGSLTAAESNAVNIAYPLADLNKDSVFNLQDVTLALRVWAGLATFP